MGASTINNKMAEYRDPRFKNDRVFSTVNKLFITLNDEDMKKYNEHFVKVLKALIDMMKSEDPFFKATFERIAYAGSYYDGLKVGKPEEFDLDIIIKLPVDYNSFTFHDDENSPAYLKMKMNALPLLRQHPRWLEYRVMDDWVDKESYFDQSKFRQWMEGVVSKALHLLEGSNPDFVLMLGEDRYILSTKKSGPAFTLCITEPAGKKIDVDLVPVLEFKTLPPSRFRRINGEKKNWLAVPKPLNVTNGNILWRLSFYEQERKILDGPVKQIIRQMKKLRDTQNFKSIASYYIKTLFLWELEARKDDRIEFVQTSPTSLFFYMLKKLRAACEVGGIKDYWDEENNLFVKIGKVELQNILCRLNKIIGKIEKQIDWNPYIIASFILTKAEMDKLKMKLPLPVTPPTNGGGSTNIICATAMGNQLRNLTISTPVILQRSISTQPAPEISSTDGATAPLDINNIINLVSSMKNEIAQLQQSVTYLTEKITSLNETVIDSITENRELKALLTVMLKKG